MEYLRTFILVVGWPFLVLGSVGVLLSAVSFFTRVKRSSFGRLVLTLVVGALVTMYCLGVTATFFMFSDTERGVPIVFLVFLLWFLVMTGVVILSRRWRTEVLTINAKYLNLDNLVEERTESLKLKALELEGKNALHEDTKRAMLNILEDTKELGDNLKKEKESVEKKIDERTNQLYEEKVRVIKFLETIPEGVLVVGANGIPFYANSELKRLLGVEMLTAPISDLAKLSKAYFLGTDTPYPSEKVPISQALLGHSAKARDIEIKNGIKNIPLEVSGAPIFNSSGEVVFAIATFKDITEEKIMERSKDEFFSIASHELRTPLTAIRGNTALIKQFYEGKLKDKDLAEMINDIHSSSVRLIGIVNDFLNTSRLEQGKMKFNNEIFNLASTLEDSIDGIQNIASEKNIYIKFDKPQDLLPDVLADKDKIKEIIINLVGNAIKFTETGGVTVGIKQDGDSLKVWVSDTGRGIDREQQNLLFRKFQQAEENLLTRDSTQGTGLGLYISKLMIEQMGGKISLESSEPNKGTVFVFSVPLPKQNLPDNAGS